MNLTLLPILENMKFFSPHKYIKFDGIYNWLHIVSHTYTNKIFESKITVFEIPHKINQLLQTKFCYIFNFLIKNIYISICLNYFFINKSSRYICKLYF